MKKPDAVTNERLKYLDGLKDSKVLGRLGLTIHQSARHLVKEFALDQREAEQVLIWWISERRFL